MKNREIVGPGKFSAWPKAAAKATATDRNSVVCRDDHTLHTFFASTTINNRCERERYNKAQGQSLSSAFTLRTLAPSA